MAIMDVNLPMPRPDQPVSDRQQALIEALIEGEQSGISDRKVSDILAAVREEANGQV